MLVAIFVANWRFLASQKTQKRLEREKFAKLILGSQIQNIAPKQYHASGIPLYKLIPIFSPHQNPRRGWHDYSPQS